MNIFRIKKNREYRNAISLAQKIMQAGSSKTLNLLFKHAKFSVKKEYRDIVQKAYEHRKNALNSYNYNPVELLEYQDDFCSFKDTRGNTLIYSTAEAYLIDTLNNF